MRTFMFLALVACSIAVTANPFRPDFLLDFHEMILASEHRSVVNAPALESIRKGNGKLAKAQRDVKPFSALTLSIPAEVVCRPSSSPGLTVRADSNLLEIINTEVVGDTLHITAAEGFTTQNPILIACSSELLNSATLHGSGEILVNDVRAPRLSVQLSGSGAVAVSGQVRRFDATVSGSGDIDAAALQAESCELQVQGAGDIRAHCVDVLVAGILGSGDIKVRGAPRQRHLSELGAGSIDVR